IAATLSVDRVRVTLTVPAGAGRLRARLHAQGLVAAERPDDGGWQVDIDAPRALLEPLFGLPGGDGEWMREALETELGEERRGHHDPAVR
ncbi:MAG: hypothetical protein J0L88_07360, partial [Xanthomonadales bacterium]|nr:hypothetical protein [Xanthomonadales bacterium]